MAKINNPNTPPQRQSGPGSERNKTQEPDFDVTKTTPITCENCGNSTFKSTIILRRMSSIMSVDGQETIFPIAVFCCEKCGNVNDEFASVKNGSIL